MTKLEKVEKIMEKTGVTYEEAKAALEAAGEDILDAIVLLENQGKIRKPKVQSYSTRQEETSLAFQEAAKQYEGAQEEKLGSVLVRFLKWCGRIIQKGCENYFIVKRNGEEIINAPVIVLVLLLVFAFWITLPILIIGLFFGYSYSFRGNITKAVDLNQACHKASEAAEAMKQEFSESTAKKKDEKGAEKAE